MLHKNVRAHDECARRARVCANTRWFCFLQAFDFISVRYQQQQEQEKRLGKKTK